MRCAAVIDIGSNSIKVLVAARQRDGSIGALLNKALDARISSGISQSPQKLAEEGMIRGLGAIRELLMEISPYRPAATALVATSAVRDAQNGADFVARVKKATGQTIRVLSGEEEANLIGRGLTADANLAELRDYYVFDLGGGSLECLSFRQRKVVKVASLPLGCVRLTEQFVADQEAAFTPESEERIRAHVGTALDEAGFRFDLPSTDCVATGGTVTTVRAMLGARHGRRVEDTAATIAVAEIRQFLAALGALPLARRRQVPALPPARADVFPAALTTLIAIAEKGGITEFRHSFHNLRWGVAAELLKA